MAEKQYDNELRGALFKAREKRGERSPDYNGNCQIEGVEYWVSGWVREGRSGNFLSLSFQRKDANGQQRESRPRQNSNGGDGFLDEGIGGGSSRPRQDDTQRLTPEQIAEMGRQPGSSRSIPKTDPSGGWDDDIPF